MNRRSFLSKICGLLPFGAGLSIVGDSGASEGQRVVCLEEDVGLRNYLQEHYNYWGSDPNNIGSYFHYIDGRYVMLSTKTPKKDLCGGQNGTLCPRCKFNEDNYWRFYINGEEVESGRAINEYGAVSWPFKGAKEGDLCTAKSPKISIAPKAEIKDGWTHCVSGLNDDGTGHVGVYGFDENGKAISETLSEP